MIKIIPSGGATGQERGEAWESKEPQISTDAQTHPIRKDPYSEEGNPHAKQYMQQNGHINKISDPKPGQSNPKKGAPKTGTSARFAGGQAPRPTNTHG